MRDIEVKGFNRSMVGKLAYLGLGTGEIDKDCTRFGDEVEACFAAVSCSFFELIFQVQGYLTSAFLIPAFGNTSSDALQPSY